MLLLMVLKQIGPTQRALSRCVSLNSKKQNSCCRDLHQQRETSLVSTSESVDISISLRPQCLVLPPFIGKIPVKRDTSHWVGDPCPSSSNPSQSCSLRPMCCTSSPPAQVDSGAELHGHAEPGPEALPRGRARPAAVKPRTCFRNLSRNVMWSKTSAQKRSSSG